MSGRHFLVYRADKIGTKLLLTEHEGRTGEYCREVRTKTTEGQYSLVRPELARFSK